MARKREYSQGQRSPCFVGGHGSRRRIRFESLDPESTLAILVTFRDFGRIADAVTSSRTACEQSFTARVASAPPRASIALGAEGHSSIKTPRTVLTPIPKYCDRAATHASHATTLGH